MSRTGRGRLAGDLRRLLHRVVCTGGMLFWVVGGARAAQAEVDAVSGATQPGQSVVGSVTSHYELLERPQPPTTDLDGDAVFILVRWSNQLSYGLANVAPPGTASLLLVPTVGAKVVTDVRVLRAVIRLCDEVLQQPALTIGIPPGAKVPAQYQALVDGLSGSVDLRLALLEHEPSRLLPAMTALQQPACQVPEPVALADAVILIPALWLDEDGAVHGALDAAAALSRQPVVGDSARVDLVSAVAPLYVFADVLRPTIEGKTESLNAILASDDWCAIDALGAQLLGAGSAAVPGLRLAAEHQLGKVRWADIAVNGVRIPHRAAQDR